MNAGSAQRTARHARRETINADCPYLLAQCSCVGRICGRILGRLLVNGAVAPVSGSDLCSGLVAVFAGNNERLMLAAARVA